MPNEANHAVQALWYQSPAQAVLKKYALPDKLDDTVRVKSSFGAISRGTEALVFHGKIPEREHDRMRAPFQEGDFPFPVKYGYATVGVVQDGPPDLIDRSVFCLYPHQSAFVVPVQAVTRIPASVPPARAVLAANMETAVNAVWDADLESGMTVSIVGAGVVGLLIAYVANRLSGCSVEIIDTDTGKAEAASALGIAFRSSVSAASERDVVFHVSATSAGLTSALQLCRFEGTVIEVSWFGDTPVSLPLGEDFHSKRLSIRCSQVGSVSPAKRKTTSHADRLAFALSLLDNPALDVLFNHDIDFLTLPSALAALFDSGSGALCPRIVY